MSINPISSNLVNLFVSDSVKSAGGLGEATGGFADIFGEALNTAAQTDTEDKESTLALLSGQADDMSGLLLDAEKAEIALNLTLQIRNKVVDAYNEIMRMQI
jgi:flagellar hook-basal body complex protein FliE